MNYLEVDWSIDISEIDMTITIRDTIRIPIYDAVSTMSIQHLIDEQLYRHKLIALDKADVTTHKTTGVYDILDAYHEAMYDHYDAKILLSTDKFYHTLSKNEHDLGLWYTEQSPMSLFERHTVKEEYIASKNTLGYLYDKNSVHQHTRHDRMSRGRYDIIDVDITTSIVPKGIIRLVKNNSYRIGPILWTDDEDD